MNDLDTMIRDALMTDAERAPHLADEWVGPTTATIVPIEPHRRGRSVMIAVGSVAAAAVAIGGLALVARPDDSVVPAATTPPAPPAWQPLGEEFPTIDLGAATDSALGPTVADLSRSIGVEGHPPLQLTTSVSYQGGATAEVLVCTSEEGGSGCRTGGPDSPLTWSLSITSSIDNRVASTDLWVVEGVTPDAASVTYVDGGLELWQRPIAGLVAFPNVDGDDEVAVAYDAAGNELARYTLEGAGQMAQQVEVPLQADLTVEQFAAISALTEDTMANCLVSAGGAGVNGGVYQFPEGIDQVAVWTSCVETTQSAVAAEVTSIAPRFFDPVTESPEADPSAYGPG